MIEDILQALKADLPEDLMHCRQLIDAWLEQSLRQHLAAMHLVTRDDWRALHALLAQLETRVAKMEAPEGDTV